MTFRSDLRDAIRAKPGISGAELKQKFPECWTPLSQMVLKGQIKKDGKGEEALYFIVEGKTKKAKATATPKTARREKRTARIDGALPRIVRGDPIGAAIAELQQRKEGIDQAIAVLESLQ